ncbi:MAG: ABC transporter ATP-binding protein [Chloroflexi bacterium]|nr:ABC transporter ATP-binding protein [Chloroflexota bacterium]
MLEVIDIHKTYEGQPLLKGISFSLAAGETICLLGASGSGKSTILRIIAGLENAESGEICWQGQRLERVPVHLRNFGLMFQDYALFPHLDVFENVAFGLRNSPGPGVGRTQKWSENEIKQRVTEVLGQVNLSIFEKRRVTELSGGEQQRVALARALAPRPRLLMLDEPLGALDRAMRERLIEELRGILHHSGIPAIYVTHDQEEAFTIADKIILLREGRVAQAGSAPEVFAKPADGWVASFLGLGNVVEGTVSAFGVETPFGRISIKTKLDSGEKVTLLLRPQAEIVESSETLTGKVADVIFRGQQFRIELENGLYFTVAGRAKVGDVVKLKILTVELL